MMASQSYIEQISCFDEKKMSETMFYLFSLLRLISFESFCSMRFLVHCFEQFCQMVAFPSIYQSICIKLFNSGLQYEFIPIFFIFHFMLQCFSLLNLGKYRGPLNFKKWISSPQNMANFEV